MEEDGTITLTLDLASVRQHEKNELCNVTMFNALGSGYLFLVEEDPALENSYSELCEKERRAFIAVDYTDVFEEKKYITVGFVEPEQVDQLVALAREAGADILEVDKADGSLMLSTDVHTMEDLAWRLALAVRPKVDVGAGEEEVVATVNNIKLTQRQLASLSRAFGSGYLHVDPDPEGCMSYFTLYSDAMERRDRPSVLVMPKWGDRRTVLVSSPNWGIISLGEAISRSAKIAREAGADVVVEAELIGMMCAVADDDRVDAVAQAICEDWRAYEKEPWPRPETAIEKQVLELAAGKQDA